jgi:predicted amidohydrolase YtcJ
LDKVRERLRQIPPGEWVVGQGTFGQNMPTSEALTREFPNNPVVLRWSRHEYVVNRKALEVSDINKATPDPVGGKIDRGPDGEPNGMLHECFDILRTPQYPPEVLREGIVETLHHENLAHGVTSVYDMPGYQAIPIYQQLHDEGKLPVRLRVSYTVEPGSEPQMDIDSLVRMQYRTGFGDDRLKIGAVKMFIDGSDGKGGILPPQLERAHRADQQGASSRVAGDGSRLNELRSGYGAGRV